jgi:predicted regulator of Ras-like GTPase activity (Roadblock/LC7/MglB family)
VDPQEALADLKQISVQIAHAVVTAPDGSVLAATLPSEGDAAQLASLARQLWEAGEAARLQLGREELAQVEVALPGGSVFVVRDGGRTILATTSPDPTVGLVFYDLKATLRSIAEDDVPAAPGPTAPASTPAPAAAAGAEESATAEEGSGDGEA